MTLKIEARLFSISKGNSDINIEIQYWIINIIL